MLGCLMIWYDYFMRRLQIDLLLFIYIIDSLLILFLLGLLLRKHIGLCFLMSGWITCEFIELNVSTVSVCGWHTTWLMVFCLSVFCFLMRPLVLISWWRRDWNLEILRFHLQGTRFHCFLMLGLIFQGWSWWLFLQVSLMCL